MLCKFLHFIFSFKAMVLLFYSLYSDYTGLLRNMAMEQARASSQEFQESLDAQQSNGNYYNYGTDSDFIGTHESCDDGTGGSRNDGEALIVCWNTFTHHPVAIIGYIIIIFSSVYGVAVLCYALWKSPVFASIEYYAYMVMTKRQKYFRRFVKIMYGVIGSLVCVYLVGMILVFAIAGVLLTTFLGSVFSTLLLAGIAATELRTTNEISFRYEIPDDKDPDFSGHVFLKCPRQFLGMSLITAGILRSPLYRYTNHLYIFQISKRICLKD